MRYGSSAVRQQHSHALPRAVNTIRTCHSHSRVPFSSNFTAAECGGVSPASPTMTTDPSSPIASASDGVNPTTPP